MAEKILIVEDDSRIARFLERTPDTKDIRWKLLLMAGAGWKL